MADLAVQAQSKVTSIFLIKIYGGLIDTISAKFQ